MAGFRLQKPYSMPKEEVREAAEGLAKKLEREHGVRYRWQGDTVSIRGAGIYQVPKQRRQPDNACCHAAV